jgi:cardiolipin synthase
VHNRVAVLNNGKATFASIMEALRSAKTFIHMEYYIFENDRVGRKIAKILMDKARAGVEVRFIYDDVGSWGLNRKFRKQMRAAGVDVRCFMRVAFPWLTSRVNYRNHRKIVVVDGHVAYTGGINIAERYLRRSKRLGMWRDTHLKLEGDAVAMLNAVFATDWYFVSGKQRLGDYDKYFPPTRVNGEVPVQIASSGPDSDWASIMQAFFSAITHAQKHIYISSPYFLPNQAILTALKIAALSGIDVRVMIPSRSDSKIVYWATRSYIGELLEAGINVYLYRRGFNHSKVIMIDGEFSSVGTANMDMRSFEDNFEITAIMYDKKIAQELEGYFLKDLEGSVKLTPEMWDERRNLHSVYESLDRLLSPLL